METMSRRNRKKKQPDQFAQLKEHVSQIDSTAITSFWQQLPGFHRKALMVLVPVVLLLLLIPVPESNSVDTTDNPDQRVAVKVNTQSLDQQRTVNGPVVQSKEWQEYRVQNGDTLAQVFRTNQLPMADLNALVAIEGLDKPLSKIKQGQLIRFKRTKDGTLDILQLEKPNSAAVMFFRMSDGGFGRSK
jgi:cell envelope opacity-associated protein A